MITDYPSIQSCLDTLSITKYHAFNRIINTGRLKFNGNETPDFIDQLSARLVCSVRNGESILVVLPDESPRRPPLLFSAALVLDSLRNLKNKNQHRKILYFGSHTGIKNQLQETSLGSLRLNIVFPQKFSHGNSEKIKSVAVRAKQSETLTDTRLPTVICIYSPANSGQLLSKYHPEWIAIDCADAHSIGWLKSLLVEARNRRISVIGWTSRPSTEISEDWIASGGSLLRWPQIRRNLSFKVDKWTDISANAIDCLVTPLLISNDTVKNISPLFTEAAEALLTANRYKEGQLATDAVLIGWRYLRALESLPVPLNYHETKAPSYWGIRKISELKAAFSSFIDAVKPFSSDLHKYLSNAYSALVRANDYLERNDPPLWLAAANICIETGSFKRLVFPSKAYREMFSFALKDRFNISEADLKEVSIAISSLPHEEYMFDGNFGPVCEKDFYLKSIPIFVGLPSHYAEKKLDRLFHFKNLKVLLLPHHKQIFTNRVKNIAANLSLAFIGPTQPFFSQPIDAVISNAPIAAKITMGPPLFVEVNAMEEIKKQMEESPFWQGIDSVDAICGLFSSIPEVEEESDSLIFLNEAALDGDGQNSWADSLWVKDAIELRFDNHTSVLMDPDEVINLVNRSSNGNRLERTPVKHLKANDEILFIKGQKRQSLFELLVSRVHKNPIVSQFILLISRWHEELKKSYVNAEKDGMTVEKLLAAMADRKTKIISTQTLRLWLKCLILAPKDPEDLKRIAEILAMKFVSDYYKQIHSAATRLRGLHISLSARLNRWLFSEEANVIMSGEDDEAIDEELGITVEDFRHSLLRMRILSTTRKAGPFYKAGLGQLVGEAA